MYDSKLHRNNGRQIVRVCPIWMVNEACAVEVLSQMHTATLELVKNILQLECGLPRAAA